MADSSATKELYNVGGAYYYDPAATKRATTTDQSAYLIDQAKSTSTSMADLGWANSSGGWVDSPGDTKDPYRNYDTNYAPMSDTKGIYSKPVIDTTWTGKSGGMYKLPDGNSVKYDGTTVGLIAAMDKYYGQGNWSDGTAPEVYPTLSQKPGSGQTPKSAGLFRGEDGLDYGYTLDGQGNRVWGSAGNEWAYPADESSDGALSWEGALARAGGQLNPIYDQQRSAQEISASQNREMLPQLMAARYGMSGTKGGRIGSQLTKSTQAEGQAINQVEGERTRGINELAQGLYEQDQARIERQMALAAEQERIAQGWAQIQNQQSQFDAEQKQEYYFRYMDDAQFQQTFGLSKEEFAYKKLMGDKEFNEGVRQFDTSMAFDQQVHADDMAYQNATLAARSSGGSSSGGSYSGGGSSSGTTKTPSTAELGAGYINWARDKMSVYEYNPQNAQAVADMTIQQLNQDIPKIGMTASQYKDIYSQIYLGLGLTPPTS